MNKKESELIFGELLENIKDISLMEEITKDPLTGEQIGKKQRPNYNPVTAATHKRVANEKAADAQRRYTQALRKGKVPDISSSDVIQAKNDARNIAQAEARSRIEADKIDELQEDAVTMAQNNIDRIDTRIESENENHQKKIERLRQQKQTYETIKSSAKQASDSSSTTQSQLSEEESKKDHSEHTKNEIEKNEENAVFGQVESKLTEGARIRLNPIDENNPTTVRNDRFGKMLFNGVSGDALRYFINNEITNANRNEIKIAKKMQADKEVMSVIHKIKWLLNRAERNRYSDQDYIDLKSEKMKFRQLFYKFNKENK